MKLLDWIILLTIILLCNVAGYINQSVGNAMWAGCVGWCYASWRSTRAQLNVWRTTGQKF